MNYMKHVLLVVFFIANCCNAQSIKDSVFTTIYMLDKEHIVANEGYYLVDIIKTPKFDKLPVLFNDTRRSTQFFADSLLVHRPFILITPNWKFYDALVEEATKNGMTMEPPSSNIYYQRSYSKKEVKVDSVIITGDQPRLVFNPSKEALEADGNIIYYHSEHYGSSCCPKDPYRETIGDLEANIAAFETKIGTKIEGTYKKITGKEGEHILYFTLSNLSKEQKLAFLKEVPYALFKNSSRTNTVASPQLFFPKAIKKEGLQLQTKN